MFLTICFFYIFELKNVMQCKNKFVLFLFLLFSLNSNAQNTFTSAGNNANGLGGSVSYSIGQIGYETFYNSNGILTFGVQQSFEIFNTGIFEKSSLLNLVSVYPNPFCDKLIIETNVFNFQKLNYQIFDVNGTMLESNFINHYQNIIDLSHLSSAVYFVKITKEDEIVKSFKIVKQ